MKNYAVGILGAGYIADWHCRALKLCPNAHIAAVADLDLGRANAISSEHGIARAFGSLSDMLEQGDVDVVHVLVPPAYHLMAAEQILAAGKHCFLEKPMCISRDECDALASTEAASEARVGVNHNFLFQPAYESLRRDLRLGRLGRIESAVIAWRKPLGQLIGGPFDLWMLAEPGNLILEVGPHSASHLLDLVGDPDEISASCGSPVELPGGRVAFRQWSATARTANASVDMLFSFGKGVSEHYVQVRGSHGSAIVDLENNVYRLDRATRYNVDFDRYFRQRNMAGSSGVQARNNLLRYVGSKFKLCTGGNPYGASIEASISAFYRSLAGERDRRHSIDFGTSAIEICERIVTAAAVDRAATPVPVAVVASNESRGESNGHIFGNTRASGGDMNGRPRATSAPVLIWGGTGFIGQHVVEGLAEAGYSVRVAARRPNCIPRRLELPGVEVVKGNLTRPEDIDHLLDGVEHVIHLARPIVKRWNEYHQYDIEPSRLLAERCLDAGVKRLIYSGTIDSYYAGKSGGKITEATGLDRAIKHRNLYAQSKETIEKILLEMHREKGLPLVIVRPGIVLGSGGSPFHWGIGMWNGESNCQVWGAGTNRLPLVLAGDVADAIVRTLEVDDIVGESFNLVADPCLTAREYLDELQRHTGVAIDALPTPVWRFYATDMFKWVVKTMVRHPERRMPSYRDWESRTQRAVFDNSKARERLGWNPHSDRETMIEQGIRIPADEVFA